MKSDLEPAKNVLRSFLKDIEAVKKMHQGISAPVTLPFKIEGRTPDFTGIECEPAPDSFWEKDNAYTWLYAEAWHYRALIHRTRSYQVPEYYRQPAMLLYEEWIALEKEVIFRGCKIPSPDKDDLSLFDYMQQLVSMITEKNEKRAVWIKSLRSFLQFIREDAPPNQQGTLEVTFPKKLRIQDGYMPKKTEKGIEKVQCRHILRDVDEEIFPIDIFAASDIVSNLVNTVLNGRPNSQHTAAEALAFTWICHALGVSRLMTLISEKSIYKLPLSSLKLVVLSKVEKYSRPECYIVIPTLYGPIDVPISKTLYDFLIALPRNSGSVYLFRKAPSALLRTFYDKGVSLSDRAKKLGKITFRTFTSQPHEAIGQRTFPMKKTAKSKEK